ncbi:hypothetical protein [Pseudonocardia parietis]|uniref:Uncharacterized protein n=1 Tax=Pseudonocardia parietis TaxID=570936 RepID=A0ABS4W6X6_9PSEU|nr:hypothetical protein [Pseudonocardia parietis]MBP2371868.1 hypothetical protein [Pseudonocardia parietis]
MPQQDHRAPDPRPGSEDADTRAEKIVARMVQRHGAPGLEHYRAGYANLRVAWPGDEEVRRIHPVTDAA